ncbi:MAG: cbb3-type cytochrome c oxidase subunit I, partial [Polyangiaceae bacterium]|nr:cbb3-type cytochrome c oxidase subunit I [Polyangiaceae bacterium]
QSLGGMEVGSIWGHGSYVAPDWTADWLHRELVFILDGWARDLGHSSYADAPGEVRAQLRERITLQTRENSYDAESGTLTISEARARAFESNLEHYADVFARGRDAYAIPRGALTDPARMRELAAFFFWSSWAAATNRPNDTITYTSNWPHEPLIANVPTGDNIVWTGVSILVLLAGIGGMAWWFAIRRREHSTDDVPENDPLLGAVATPSQVATVKYFWVVSLLILVQMLLGVVTAHYGVEGSGFYGIPLADYVPYVVTRTWHVQLGIFWIATAWLAAGLYIGPAVGGHEPKYQRLFVNVLFVALLVIVVGSLAGQWLSVKQKLGQGDAWFYFGHSGYEYIDLGRAFQILLLIGLFIWLALVARTIWPALAR